jgi:hypothetical protein
MAQKFDFSKAKSNPSKFFERPNDVLNNHALSRAQKIELLHQWELDARLMSVAEEENMAGAEPTYLQEVVKALISLGDEAHLNQDSSGSAAAKHGDAPDLKAKPQAPATR